MVLWVRFVPDFIPGMFSDDKSTNGFAVDCYAATIKSKKILLEIEMIVAKRITNGQNYPSDN